LKIRLFDPRIYYRISRWLYVHGVPLLPRVVDRINQAVFHCYIYHQTSVGENLGLGHHGIGVVVHPRVTIGNNVFLAQCVVLGGRSESHEVPVIEDNVYIASGAKVLGGVVIGEGSVIGANAVVIHSVAPRSIVAGVPARLIRENINIFDYTGWPKPKAVDQERKS
jgi:serine O-acetyltransferase